MAFYETRRTYIHAPASRRFFWWFLFVSYFFVTATVLFLTLGYRFNFASNIFVHTGSIHVKAEPRDVSVLIDGRPPAQRHLNFINSSYHITGLPHGEHTVTFSAPGYKPWTEDVIIRSGVATEFWNIVLVRNQYEKTAYDVADPQDFFFAPGNARVAYTRESQRGTLLSVRNIEDQQLENTALLEDATFAASDENIEWSPRQGELLLPVLRAVQAPVIEDTASSEQDAEGNPVTSLGADGSVTDDAGDPGTSVGERDEQDDDIAAVAGDDTTEPKVYLPEPQKDYVIARRGAQANFTFTYLGSILQKIHNDTRKDTAEAGLIAPSPTGVEQLAEEAVKEQISVEEADAVYTEPVVTHVRWLPKQESILYALVDESLTQVAVVQDEEGRYDAEVIAQDILAYDFADDGIFVLTRDGNLLFDKDVDGKNLEVLTHITDSEATAGHRLIAYDQERVAHIDSSGRLSIYNKQGEKVLTRVLGEEIVDARFSDDGKKLIYHTETTINVYFTRTWNSQPLRAADSRFEIFRFDTPLTNVEWAPDYEHVIATSDGRIQLLDLDHRGDHNLTEIATHYPADGRVIMDTSDNRIFFTDGDEEGVVLQSLLLQRVRRILN